jgi:hypothetical protein
MKLFNKKSFANNEDLLEFGIAFAPSPDTFVDPSIFGTTTITYGYSSNITTAAGPISFSHYGGSTTLSSHSMYIGGGGGGGSSAIYDLANNIKPSVSFADSGLAFSSGSSIVAADTTIFDRELTSEELQVMYEEALEREQDV